MKLRYDGTCAICLARLPAGTEADWDRARRTVTCVDCADATDAIAATGTAGGSAQAEADARRVRKAAQEQRIKEAHPVLGRIVLAVSPLEDTGRSWATGANGEQQLGASIERRVERGLLALHDRRLPRSKANIDHLVVAPNGVWVIDAKRYKGEVRRRGGRFGLPARLEVAGRDRTKLVEGVHRQMRHVSEVLDSDIPVRGALCFVDARWLRFSKPFLVDGVLVSWGQALLDDHVLGPGPLDEQRRRDVHRQLAVAFPPAT